VGSARGNFSFFFLPGLPFFFLGGLVPNSSSPSSNLLSSFFGLYSGDVGLVYAAFFLLPLLEDEPFSSLSVGGVTEAGGGAFANGPIISKAYPLGNLFCLACSGVNIISFFLDIFYFSTFFCF